MPCVLTLIADPAGPGIDDTTIAAARDALAGCGANPAPRPDWLAPRRACDIAFGGADPAGAQSSVRARLAGAALDIVAQPRAGRRKKLLVADMESTIIANEFVDELAEFAGAGARVAAITDRVVRGELEFAAALEERVAMLAGLPVEILDRAYAHLKVNPGARALAATMRAAGAHTALVSGGFTCFSARVRAELGFDTDHANTLEVVDGRLAGNVVKPILDRAAKRARLEALRGELGLAEAETIAVGDGANDLDMLAAAGMGVAFRAKPVVAAAARARIDHGNLTTLLYIQGYRSEDIVS
jgi:phosphoserine phosphatase